MIRSSLTPVLISCLLALACLSMAGCKSSSVSAAGGSSAGLVQASAPTGNGKRFGTRDTRDCSLTADNPTGAQLQQIFICQSENLVLSSSFGDHLDLVSNVSLQFSKSRPFNQLTDSFQGIDVTQRVFDVRGVYTHWECFPWTADPNPMLPQPGKNCYKFPPVPQTGIAYRDTFGNWHVPICCQTQRDMNTPYWPPPTDLL